MKKVLIGIAIIFFLILAPNQKALADCDRPSTMAGNVTLTASCTYTYTYDGVDNPGNNEASTTNTATITLGNFNLTVGAGQILVGNFIITGTGGIAIGSGSLLPGGALWIYDNDADGWLTDFTNNSYRRTSTAAGYRRLGLMMGTTADCDDTNNALTNNCYSYSESSYYGYGEGNYYSYSYSYGQSSYVYGYGQSSYASYVSCFLAGTKILLANGSYKQIQDIRPGETIMSYDLLHQQAVPETVTELLTHPNTKGGYLILNNRLNVTGNHLMWIANRNAWVHAEDLTVGDMLTHSNGSRETIASITHVNGTNTTYNLHLTGDNHNYFAEGVLVHNWKI